MKRCNIIILLAVLLLSAVSCVHEFPDETTPADFLLKLRFNIEINVNTNVNSDVHGGKAPDEVPDTRTLNSKTHDIRYIVKFYRLVNGDMATEPSYEHVFTVDDITVHELEESLEIDEGHYRLFVWADYVPQGSSEDDHYRTDGFPIIEMNIPQTGCYEGSLESRDAYVGYTDIDVVRYGKNMRPVEADIDIHRPLAKFVVISDDLDEFVTKITQQRNSELMQKASAGLLSTDEAELAATKAVDLDEFDVKFYFMGDESVVYNAPTTFDVYSDKPVATAPGLSFTSKLVQVANPETGMMEAQLGFDYIFVNGNDTHTRVVVGVFNKDGEQVSMTKSMKIPLKRNHVTYVRDGFLMQNIEGGAVVEPGFDGPDFNYEIK